MNKTTAIKLVTGKEPCFDTCDFEAFDTYKVSSKAGECSISRLQATADGGNKVWLYSVKGSGPAISSDFLAAVFDNEEPAWKRFQDLYETLRRVQVLLF